MRVLIVAVGSRGDLAPYVGLGARLQQQGCQVAIATHDRFAGEVTAMGLEWRRLSGDTHDLIRSRMEHDSDAAWRQALTDFTTGMGDDIAAAAELGTDVVLTPFGQAPMCTMVAAGLGVPCMGVYLAPSVPTAEFPLPGSAAVDGNGAPDNKVAGEQLLRRGRAIYAEVLPRLGRRLGLSADEHEVVWDRFVSSEGLARILHGYSAAVVPRPGDWPDDVEVVGYWWPAVSPAWRPSQELTDFLQAGPPPVFVGFGSMAVGRGAELGPVILAALREARVRAVVQSGWADVSVDDDEVLQIGDVPHEWLFARMAATVHHAGAGTTGAGLRAGLPAVTVPVLVDQPFWADRVHRLGAGPPPIPFAELTAPRLASAIQAALGQARYREQAANLADLIAREDGAETVARRIEQLRP